MKLWRAIGPRELAGIEAMDWSGFPARRADQPFFYPVLTFAYAEEIARDWKSTDRGHDYRGYVVGFELADAYAARFPARNGGGRTRQELWVPSSRLGAFNRHLDGPIELVVAYLRGRRAAA